jgi:outer membrane biosynthesis protein TonB
MMRYILSTALGVTLAMALAFGQDTPIRVGGNVAAANRVYIVAPVYPPDAKENRIQGTVKLEITIDKEGHVGPMSVISGPPELIHSATDAVSQ